MSHGEGGGQRGESESIARRESRREYRGVIKLDVTAAPCAIKGVALDCLRD